MDMEAFKEEVRARSDIVDVIRGYVTLKQNGATWKGLCPFHNEKTPSFNVDSRRQIFHCFGCGAGGDVFSFVQRTEGMAFAACLEFLANRAGLTMPARRGGGKGEASGDRDPLLQLHQEATTWLEEQLHTSPAAKQARDYLAKRQLSEESIRSFRIGFAPDEFQALRTWGRSKGYSDALMEKAGVVTRGERGGDLYDRFRGRIMFPIFNPMGQVIAFSGRLMVEAERAPKYLNSPATPLFVKSQVLYALDRARQAMVSSRQAILCEGQIDVIRCHSVGITQAVAAQGTALTEFHARKLRQFADEVILVLDADTAGENAAIRSARLFLQAGLPARIATLPQGEDPDSLILRYGPEVFLKTLEEARDAVDFQAELLLAREQDNGAAGKLRVITALFETIADTESAVQQEEFLRKTAPKLGTSFEALRRDFLRTLEKKPVPRAQPAPTVEAPVAVAPVESVPPPRDEMLLLELLCQHPELISVATQYLTPRVFANSACAALFEHIATGFTTTGDDWPARLPAQPEGMHAIAAHIVMSSARVGSETGGAEEGVRDIIMRLRLNELIRRRETLKATGRADEMEVAQLVLVISDLRSAMKRHRWDEATPILEVWMPE
jgi:DNA primase